MLEPAVGRTREGDTFETRPKFRLDHRIRISTGVNREGAWRHRTYPSRVNLRLLPLGFRSSGNITSAAPWAVYWAAQWGV